MPKSRRARDVQGNPGARMCIEHAAHALRLARELRNATIVFIVCDRGDRYLSTGVFPA